MLNKVNKAANKNKEQKQKTRKNKMNKPESARYATISNTKFKNLVLRAVVVDYVAEKSLKLTIVAGSENLDIILRGGKHCDNIVEWVSKKFNIPAENLVVTSISLGKKFWSPIWKAREAEKREKIKAEKAALKAAEKAEKAAKREKIKAEKAAAKKNVRKNVKKNDVTDVTDVKNDVKNDGFDVVKFAEEVCSSDGPARPGSELSKMTDDEFNEFIESLDIPDGDDVKNDVKNDVTEVKNDDVKKNDDVVTYGRKDIFDNTVRPVKIISMPDVFGGTEKKNDVTCVTDKKNDDVNDVTDVKKDDDVTDKKNDVTDVNDDVKNDVRPRENVFRHFLRRLTSLLAA